MKISILNSQSKLLKLIILSNISLLSLLNNSYAIEPLFTKSASIYSDITIDSAIGYYNGRELEEVKDFDAYEVKFDITVPVFQKAQFRLSIPAYTNGSGIVTDPGLNYGKSTDIKGNNGTYDFLSLGLEYQFKQSSQSGYNLLAYGNFAARSTYLDTSHGDKLNHKGTYATIGVRYDNIMSQYKSNLLATLEYRYYWDTDDLNPGNDNSTSFNIVNMSGAWVWNTKSSFSPVMELTYSTDIKSYHAISLIPEIIYTINPSIDLKLGMPIGVTGDADDYGLRFGITTRF